MRRGSADHALQCVDIALVLCGVRTTRKRHHDVDDLVVAGMGAVVEFGAAGCRELHEDHLVGFDGDGASGRGTQGRRGVVPVGDGQAGSGDAVEQLVEFGRIDGIVDIRCLLYTSPSPRDRG